MLQHFLYLGGLFFPYCGILAALREAYRWSFSVDLVLKEVCLSQVMVSFAENVTELLKEGL